MKFTKKIIIIELLALFTMLGMSNTAEYCMTKGMLNQGYTKKAIEEHYYNTRYNKPIIREVGYELNK
ncbi:MAG: hypothetical protein Q8O03_05150, partial [Nanoarchaeota archaeon]|nr:hypothetical protein [Nanoarchaeota archaeon]